MRKIRVFIVLALMVALLGCQGMSWQNKAVTSYEGVGITIKQVIDSYRELKTAGLITPVQDAQFWNAYTKVYYAYQSAGSSLSVAITATDPQMAKDAMAAYEKAVLELPQLVSDVYKLVMSFKGGAK